MIRELTIASSCADGHALFATCLLTGCLFLSPRLRYDWMRRPNRRRSTRNQDLESNSPTDHVSCQKMPWRDTRTNRSGFKEIGTREPSTPHCCRHSSFRTCGHLCTKAAISLREYSCKRPIALYFAALWNVLRLSTVWARAGAVKEIMLHYR